MTDLTKPVKQGANAAAAVLETAAGILRGIGGDAPTPEPSEPPKAPRTPQQAPHETRGTKPAAGTRSRISNPKAAKRARSREG